MQMVEQYFIRIVTFFTTNYIAAGILALVVIIALIKKPKEFFKAVALIVFAVGVFYVMVYLEKSMFSGVSSGKKAYDVEQRAGEKN